MRELLIVGQLNDGAETAGSDVYRTLLYAQVLLGVELGARLSDQLPNDCTCIQGDAGTADEDTGIAIRPGLMGVQAVRWDRLDPWRKTSSLGLLTVRVNYQGSLLSLMTTKRPASLSTTERLDFEQALGDRARAERLAGWAPILGYDGNDADPQDIEDATLLSWHAPYPTSVVGLLTSGRIQVVACSSLQRRAAEHPPVIAMLKVPLP